MTSRTTARSRKAFALLPGQIQEQSRQSYRLFRQNPHHSSPRYRQVHPSLPIYSARVGIQYRAVARHEGEEIIWFWIDPHAEYDAIIGQL